MSLLPWEEKVVEDRMRGTSQSEFGFSLVPLTLALCLQEKLTFHLEPKGFLPPARLLGFP